MDYSSAVTGASTSVSTLLSQNGTTLLGIVAVVAGFGLVMKLVKRAMK